MRYHNILFDLDGTLLDTRGGFLASVKHTIAVAGLPEIPLDILLSFIGPPIRDSLQNYYSLTDLEADRATEIFRNQYKCVHLFNAQVYAGIMELLKSLKENNIHIAVATYKRHDYAIDLLEHFKIAPYCDYIHGSDDKDKKNKRGIIRRCIKDLNPASLSDAVLIGDTKFDALGAESVGVDFIGVTYGFGFQTKDEVSEYKNSGVAEYALEIWDLIK